MFQLSGFYCKSSRPLPTSGSRSPKPKPCFFDVYNLQTTTGSGWMAQAERHRRLNPPDYYWQREPQAESLIPRPLNPRNHCQHRQPQRLNLDISKFTASRPLPAAGAPCQNLDISTFKASRPLTAAGAPGRKLDMSTLKPKFQHLKIQSCCLSCHDGSAFDCNYLS